MASESEQAIRMRAYEIWMQEGCPENRALEHWAMARQELGFGTPDLERNPGIGASAGATGSDADELAGENTEEGDVLNDTGLGGGIDPDQRGRTNR